MTYTEVSQLGIFYMHCEIEVMTPVMTFDAPVDGMGWTSLENVGTCLTFFEASALNVGQPNIRLLAKLVF